MDELALIEKAVAQTQNRYYGKYRAFVADNADPDKRGRVKLTIPSVLAATVSDWALPCLPYGGAAGLGFLAVPPVGAQVVAEFMEGDVSAPLWTGTFWRTADEVPEEITESEPTVKLLKTDSGHVLTFEDKDGEEAVTLRSAKDAVLEMQPNGSLALTDSGGATVTLDAEAGELRVADANGNELVMSSSGITAKDASGNEISTAASGVTVKGATVTIEGQQVAVGGSGGEPLIKGTAFMTIFNSHVHNCTAPGAPSGPPLPPMTPAQLSLTNTTT